MNKLVSKLFLLASLLVSNTITANSVLEELDNEQELQEYTIRALILANNETTFSAPLAEQIIKLKVDAGDSFKQGETLVEFDCSQLKAALRAAMAELSVAESIYNSDQEMAGYESISQRDLNISAAKYEQKLAEVETIQVSSHKCKLIAPFYGMVVKRHSNPFETPRIGDPILAILDNSTLRVELQIPSNWLRWLKVGSEFKLHIDETDKVYNAVINKLGAKVDPVSQTITVFAELNSLHHALLPGMSGNAMFSPPIKSP